MSKKLYRKGHHEKPAPRRTLDNFFNPPRAGERLGTAAGGASRPTEQYWARQALLEQEVELARRRYEAAQKRWNDLK